MCKTLLVALACGMFAAVACAAPASTPTPTALPALSNTPTLTVSRVQEIRARGRLIVSVRQEQGPRETHLDPVHPRTRALEVALARAIARKLLGDENRLEVKSGPAKAVVSTIQGSQVDLAFATIYDAPTTDALKRQIEVSEPFATGGVVLIARTGSGLGALKDLNERKVAYVTAGRDYRPEFDTIAKKLSLSITMEQFASYDEAATALERGQVQALLGHTIIYTFYVAQQPGRFELVGKPLTTEQFSILASKGDSELIAIVNEVIKGLKASGELLRLAQQAGFPVESLALP